MKWGPTANFVGGQLVACYYDTCERYDNATGEWTKIADTSSTRFKHSSAQIENQILLIGGTPPNFTEWIPANGGPSVKGPLDIIRHGEDHCTIQVSSDLIVVTGGTVCLDTLDYVTEYKLNGNVTETEMTSLINGRRLHACGVYREADGQQVRISW